MEKREKTLTLMVVLILGVVLVIYILYLLGYKFEGFVYDKF